jgi:hypothetical protein
VALCLSSGCPDLQDLYRVLALSLRNSSYHFQSLTLETLALGW